MEIERLVVLSRVEADVLVHVLAVFERLLRQGDLQPDQMRHLVAGSGLGPCEQPDVEMAEVVAEAAQPLYRQL
jgi:hypothetical protein